MENRNYSKENENSSEQRVRLLESDELFGDGNEIMIRHDGAVYRLRITKNGKLIMNK